MGEEPVDLDHVLRIEGAGALVSGLVPAVPGIRTVDRDGATGRIVDQRFEVFPEPLRMIRTGPADGPSVILTFEGLPAREQLAELLALLDRHGIEATFFVTSSALLADSEAAQSVVQSGHVLGVRASGIVPDSATNLVAAQLSINGLQLLVGHETGGRARLVTDRARPCGAAR
jgi:peptidoglycan/xylan/chitin deacetylase (PgdA/CDA1 family)